MHLVRFQAYCEEGGGLAATQTSLSSFDAQLHVLHANRTQHHAHSIVKAFSVAWTLEQVHWPNDVVANLIQSAYQVPTDLTRVAALQAGHIPSKLLSSLGGTLGSC